MTGDGAPHVFEPPGTAPGTVWRVQFDGAGTGLSSGTWTGRAASARRAEAVAKMAIDITWNALTGTRDGLPGHLASSLETQTYGTSDASKIATRAIGEPMHAAASREAGKTVRLSRDEAGLVLASICASDEAIHHAALKHGVRVTLSANPQSSMIPRKHAQVLVSRIRRGGWIVPISRATEIALMALNDHREHVRLPMDVPQGGKDEVTFQQDLLEAPATLRAAHVAKRFDAVELARDAGAFLRLIGADAAAEAIAAQARDLQERPL